MPEKKEEASIGAAILGLAALIFGIPTALAAVILPLLLLQAWLRETVWNWYAPHFGWPHIGLWLMVAISCFIGLWRGVPRQLKDEHYKGGFWGHIATDIFNDLILFGVVWLIHMRLP